MRYYYKNKNSDFYSPSLIDNPLFWIIATLIIFIVSTVIIHKGFTCNGLLISIRNIAIISFITVTTWQLIDAKKHLGKLSRLGSYLVNYGFVQAIDNALLNSKSAAAMVNHSYQVLPKIWVYRKKDALIFKIQKLAGTFESDLDKTAELVSSAVGEYYKVTSKEIEENQSWFKFICKPVETDLRFVPKSIDDLIMQPYHLKLMKNIVVDVSKCDHIAIFGKTGSRKSTLIWVLISQTLGNSENYFIDFKNEFSILSSFYPKSHFAINTDEVIILLQKMVALLNKRKKIVADAAKKRGISGITASDIGLQPCFLYIDEFASVLTAFKTAKEKKQCLGLLLQILMQARSLGMVVVYSCQSPSTENLPQQLRSQFGTYILLGSANSDVQRMAFGQIATTGTVETGSGYYLEDVAEMVNPQRFWVPDAFKYKVNTLSTYKQLYERGNFNE